MTDHYVTKEGVYIGGYGDGAMPDDADLINLGENAPADARQVWQFPGWGPIQVDYVAIENEWRITELLVIARQLEAIEEDEVDETPDDLLPGTRKQWLGYRGKVTAWKEGYPDFPDSTKRPQRP